MIVVTLRETVDELTREGYSEDFFAVPAGLRAARSGKIYAPEDLVTDRVARIDEDTDPADQVIVYALHAPDGARGTYVAAFGPAIDAADAAILPQLDRS